MSKLHRRWSSSYRINQGFGLPFEIDWQNPQAKGLVALWTPLAHPGTFPLRDMAGGRYPMTAYNSPTWVSDGEMGWAVLFDDTSSEYLSNSNAVVSEPPFTLSCWFNSDTADGLQVLIGIGQQFSNTDFFNMWLSSSDVRLRTQESGAFDDAVTTGAYSLNAWTHAAAVAVSSTNRSVFRDGGNKGTSATDLAPTGLYKTTISRHGGSGNQWFMSGMITDVRIYNRALTDAEVSEQYHNPWDLYKPIVPRWIMAAPSAPAGAITNQLQGPNVGTDLYNGTLL